MLACFSFFSGGRIQSSLARGGRTKIKKFDRDRVANWLNQHWTGKKRCPICKNNNWTISDTIFELCAFHGGGLVVVGGSVISAVSVPCNVCSHTLFFNAIKLDVVRVPKTKEGGDNAESSSA